MNTRRFALGRTHVHRPEPALEPVLLFLVAVGLFTLLATIWSIGTGESLSPLSWYIARASGFILYLLSAFLVVSGLGTTAKLLANTGNRSLAWSLHGYAFHLWYGFLALHMVSLALDPTVNLSLAELSVPFISDFREPWTGLGIVAAQLGVITGASTAIRRVLGYRTWKAIHWLSLPAFALGLFHGLLAGSDSGTSWALIIYLVTGGWVIFLIAYRFFTRHTRALRSQDRLPAERFRSVVSNESGK